MTSINIPTLETERLTLRAPTKDDFPAYAKIFASDRSKYMGGPHDTDRAWRGMAGDIMGWIVLGYGYWSFEENASGEFAGFIGLAKPPSYPERELGWMITAKHEGKGYAFEAARAARNYAYADLGWTTLVSYIDAENHRSIALAERLDCVVDPDASFAPGDPCLVYRHPSPEAL